MQFVENKETHKKCNKRKNMYNKKVNKIDPFYKHIPIFIKL